MDSNDLFDGNTETFQQYQAEITKQEQALSNPNPAGPGAKTEAEKTEKKVATEKRIKGNFPKRE